MTEYLLPPPQRDDGSVRTLLNPNSRRSRSDNPFQNPNYEYGVIAPVRRRTGIDIDELSTDPNPLELAVPSIVTAPLSAPIRGSRMMLNKSPIDPIKVGEMALDWTSPGLLTRAPRGALTSGILGPPREGEPSFFSAAERAANNMAQKKGTGAVMLKRIKESPGVKAEEIEWIGLDEFLRDKPEVTKDEIIAFIRANKLALKEVRYPRREELQNLYFSPEKYRAKIENMSMEDLAAEVASRRWELENNPHSPSFAHLFPDGHEWGAAAGGAYPPRRAGGAGAFNVLNLERALYEGDLDPKDIIRRLADDYGESVYPKRIAEQDRMRSRFQDGDPTIVEAKHGSPRYQMGGVSDNYRELVWHIPGSQRASNNEVAQRLYGSDYRDLNLVGRDAVDRWVNQNMRRGYSSHAFPEKDIVVWVRANDRVDLDGKSHLFIEEFQSDWHQKGAREGYRGAGVDRRTGEWSGVPDAPLKGTGWHNLAFRRAVEMAVQGGYDSVSWTTSATQKARYSDPASAGAGKLFESLYDKRIVNHASKFSRKYGGGDVTKSSDLNPGYEIVEITPEIYKELLHSGLTTPHSPNGPGMIVGGEWRGFRFPEGWTGVGQDLHVTPDDLVGKFVVREVRWTAGNEGSRYLGYSFNSGFVNSRTVRDTKPGDKAALSLVKEAPTYLGKSRAEMRKIMDDLRGKDPNFDFSDQAEEVWTMKITDKMREAVLEEGVPTFSSAGVPSGLLGPRKPADGERDRDQFKSFISPRNRRILSKRRAEREASREGGLFGRPSYSGGII